MSSGSHRPRVTSAFAAAALFAVSLVVTGRGPILTTRAAGRPSNLLFRLPSRAGCPPAAEATAAERRIAREHEKPRLLGERKEQSRNICAEVQLGGSACSDWEAELR